MEPAPSSSSAVATRITQVLENITALVRQAREREGEDRGGSRRREGTPWRDDPVLQGRMSNVKAASQAFAMSCSKLAFLASRQPSVEALQSLEEELVASTDVVMMSFLQVSDCAICQPLFYQVQQLLRSQLLTAKEFVDAMGVDVVDYDAVSNGAGVVFKIYDKVQLLPMTNKAAYRRFIMEKMSLVKDSVLEFERYVSEAEAGGDAGGNRVQVEDQEDDDDDDDDEDDVPYTAKEAATASSCLHLLRCALDALRTCLAVMTLVADAQCPAGGAANNSGESVFVALTTAALESKAACEEWVAELCALVRETEAGVTDLGAELYSPFDEVKIEAYYNTLGTTLALQCSTLRREEYQSLLPGDVAQQLAALNTTLGEIGTCTFLQTGSQ